MAALVLRADRLLDGTGSPPLAPATLVIEDGLVRHAIAGPAPEGAIPHAAQIVDLPGCTILPGLIDAHIHLNLPGDGATLEEAVRENDGVLTATATLNAVRALAAGITTVRDLGAARGTVFDVRRALTLGHGHGARIVACGQPLSTPAGIAGMWVVRPMARMAYAARCGRCARPAPTTRTSSAAVCGSAL